MTAWVNEAPTDSVNNQSVWAEPDSSGFIVLVTADVESDEILSQPSSDNYSIIQLLGRGSLTSKVDMSKQTFWQRSLSSTENSDTS